MEIISFGLVCEYVNCSDVRISCNNCMWSGTIIPQRGGESVTAYPCTKNNLTLLCPKLGWKLRYLSQRPPLAKMRNNPKPIILLPGKVSKCPKRSDKGGGVSIIPCRRLCAFCTNGFNTAAPKWSDFLCWNRTFLGKKTQNWSDFSCISRCIALNWYFSREWKDKGIV